EEAQPVAPPRSRWSALGVATGLALLAAALAGVSAWRLKPEAPRPVTRLSHVLGEDQSFGIRGRPLIAMSPDGSTVVYAGRRSLYRRRLSDWEAAPIRGTDGSPTTPFFSPDGESVGYWDAAAGQLRRVFL